MVGCFVCGCVIPKGTEIRRSIYTGASIGGFNLSSNIVVNWALNSLLSNRRQSVRSYYSKKTVCPSCNANISKNERRKTIAVLLILCFVFMVGIALYIGRAQRETAALLSRQPNAAQRSAKRCAADPGSIVHTPHHQGSRLCGAS
jgi:hypothetical protein